MLENYYESPIGLMSAWTDDTALYYLDFVPEGSTPENPRKRLEKYLAGVELSKGTNALTSKLFSQLDEYFFGNRREFDIPLKLYGTTFQLAVWAGLSQIPYGKIISYGQLAAMVGKPRSPRAVGGANHNNPISILVPCHRVIGASGKLTGYGGGLDRKEFLLNLERVHSLG